MGVREDGVGGEGKEEKGRSENEKDTTGPKVRKRYRLEKWSREGGVGKNERQRNQMSGKKQQFIMTSNNERGRTDVLEFPLVCRHSLKCLDEIHNLYSDPQIKVKAECLVCVFKRVYVG